MVWQPGHGRAVVEYHFQVFFEQTVCAVSNPVPFPVCPRNLGISHLDFRNVKVHVCCCLVRSACCCFQLSISGVQATTACLPNRKCTASGSHQRASPLQGQRPALPVSTVNHIVPDFEGQGNPRLSIQTTDLNVNIVGPSLPGK